MFRWATALVLLIILSYRGGCRVLAVIIASIAGHQITNVHVYARIVACALTLHGWPSKVMHILTTEDGSHIGLTSHNLYSPHPFQHLLQSAMSTIAEYALVHFPSWPSHRN